MASSIFLYCLVLLGLTISVTSQEYIEDPPLPDLPDQFYLKLEVNDKELNKTVYLEEFYDGPGNRGAVVLFVDNRTTYVTYDLNNLQTIAVTRDQGRVHCEVSDLKENSTLPVIGFHDEGGKIKIDSTADLLRFGDHFNETYVGLYEVRGIPVDHWVADLSIPNHSTLELHYYFTVKGYHSASNGSQIPVRATINGTAIKRGTNTTYNVDSVYEFFDFHLALPWKERAFEPPLGVSCIGRKSRKELPELPGIFSMRGEWMSTRQKKVDSFSVYYNYPGKMTAFTFHMSRSGVTSIIKLVHDFNYGLTYSINEKVGSCDVSAINVTGFTPPDVVVAPDGSHTFQQDPTSFFIPPNLTWAYEGKSELRAMTVESWISEPHDSGWRKNQIVQIFFASVNYSTIEFPTSVTHFPVQKIERGISFNEMSGQNESWEFIINVFAFDHDLGGPWHFDTSDCVDEEDQIPLAFDLDGTENFHNYVQNNSRNFYFGAHDSIVKATKLPGSRVTQFQVEEGDDEVLSIFFTLLGVPKIQGNAVHSAQKHSITVQDAEKHLETVINGKGLFIQVDIDGKTKSITVVKGSLRQNFSTPKTSVGGTVVVAIVALLTGLFIGVMLVLAKQKYDRKIPYQTQE